MNGIYLCQDPVAVAAMWKDPSLSSPIFIYTVGLRYLFGMKEKAIETYTADNSGPYRKPHPKSKVPSENRVDFLTHDSLLRGLTGPAMVPTFRRFQKIFNRNLNLQVIGEEWVEMEDFYFFFREKAGKAVLESLFGPSMLRINPGFVDDLWAFDEEIKNLTKRLPRFWIPNAYRVRDRLIAQIQNWYQYACKVFRHDAIYEDCDGDSFWGSSMSRERQELVLSINTRLWNTQEGKRPVTSFWAERFIVDASDPQSGPVRPDIRDECMTKAKAGEEGKFSLQGLSGAWIPYGGEYEVEVVLGEVEPADDNRRVWGVPRAPASEAHRSLDMRAACY
jgi:hypothetical protein